MPVLEGFAVQVARQPGRVALQYRGRSWSYAAVEAEVGRLAGVVCAVSAPGELIAIWLDNRPELLLLHLACWRCGRVPMPLHGAAKWPEVQGLLEHAGMPLLVSAQELYGPHREAARRSGLTRVHLLGATDETPCAPPGPPVRPTLESIVLVLHTSGSQGRPKAVMLAAANVAAVVGHRIARMGLTGDSVLVVGSCLSQSVGLYQSLALLASGGRLVLLDSYAAGPLIEALERQRPTHLVMVVEAYDRLLHHPRVDAGLLGSLRFAAVGADRVTPRVQRRAMELTGRPLCVSYGLSESSWALFNTGDRADQCLALGEPTGGAEIRLCDAAGCEVPRGAVGEIHIRSPRTMRGYLNDIDETQAVLREGWLASGDLAYRDQAGCYWFAGRSKNLIVLPSGDVVAPVEIESLLLTHPGVARCLVVAGVRDDGAQYPVLYVVRSDPALDGACLLHFLRERLADFKLPQRIEFRAELPTGVSGKIRAPGARAAAGVPAGNTAPRVRG